MGAGILIWKVTMWIYPALTAGLNWPSIQRPLYLLLLTVLLVSLCIVGWLVITLRRLTRESIGPPPEQLGATAWIRAGQIAQVKRKAMSAGKYLGVLLVGFVLGLGWKTYDYHAKYLQDYAAWEARSRDYQRMYAVWIAQHKLEQEMSK